MYASSGCFKVVLLLYALTSLLSVVNAFSFLNVYPRISLPEKSSKNAGDPLFITPYLKKGAIELAQNLSRVSITEDKGFRSHAGFFTIDEKSKSNLYFWYFPPISKNEEAPVILWLQGGPGGSSMFGLFTEIGPIIPTKNGFVLRRHHWAINYHLIFIDNPVGTGFSFTDMNAYCKDENCVSEGLYSAMSQFFTLFPNLKNNEFYITGESYAGKYIPSLAMKIHQENQNADKKINLAGMAMGNAYCDPINQLDYGNYLYQHGLIDDNQRKVFLKFQKEIATQIHNENWAHADVLMDTLMDGDLSNFSYFKSYTGFNNYYNFLKTDISIDMKVFTDLLNNDEIRKSVHVGGRPFNDGKAVQLNLVLDILKSVAPVVSELLAHYKILVYNGQLDIIVAYPLTENFLRNLNFPGSDVYKTAKRQIWRVDDEIAGYYKMAGNLTELLFRNAGHMVPQDQPKWALDMITRFIHNGFKVNN